MNQKGKLSMCRGGLDRLFTATTSIGRFYTASMLSTDRFASVSGVGIVQTCAVVHQLRSCTSAGLVIAHPNKNSRKPHLCKEIAKKILAPCACSSNNHLSCILNHILEQIAYHQSPVNSAIPGCLIRTEVRTAYGQSSIVEADTTRFTSSQSGLRALPT